MQSTNIQRYFHWQPDDDDLYVAHNIKEFLNRKKIFKVGVKRMTRIINLRNSILTLYEQHQGVKLNLSKFEKNEGQRAFSKVCLQH